MKLLIGCQVKLEGFPKKVILDLKPKIDLV